MSRTIRARLAKLEAASSAMEILVWCDIPEQMEETIQAMIATDEIRPDQRNGCVFWQWARFSTGTHETMLELLGLATD
jgi:hypothetical protein